MQRGRYVRSSLAATAFSVTTQPAIVSVESVADVVEMDGRIPLRLLINSAVPYFGYLVQQGES